MAPLTYADTETLRDARARYWAANDFGDDGGYSKKWEIIKLGPMPIPVRNVEARKDAIRYHDLHHLITGYDTDLAGEAEISAWELATGCGSKWVAWILDLQGLLLGLAWPGRLLRAWTRGRHSRNLYSEPFDDALLSTTVGELRVKLALDQPVPAPSAGDRVSLIAWITGSIVGHLAGLAVVVGGIWWIIARFF